MIKDCVTKACFEANRFVDTVDQHLKVLNKNGWRMKSDMDPKVRNDIDLAQLGLVGAAFAMIGAAFAATLVYDAIKLSVKVVVFVVSLVIPQNPFLRTAVGITLFVLGHEVMVLARNTNDYRAKQENEREFIRVVRKEGKPCFIFIKECFQSNSSEEPERDEGAEGEERGVSFSSKADVLAYIFTDGLIIPKFYPDLTKLFAKYIAADNQDVFKKFGIKTK